GRAVLLADQDRRHWDHAQIARGRAALRRARALGGDGDRYVLQAASAECHARARRHADTDWARIAALYGTLARAHPSPVVELNRVVAVARAEGAEAGWALLAPLLDDARLRGYAPLWAVQGDLLAQLGRGEEARAAFARAAGLTGNAREREVLLARAGAAPARAHSGRARGREQRAQPPLEARGPGRVPGEAGLVHVAALAHLQLHRLHALFGAPVVARDVAALEAPVGHPAVVVLARQHPRQPLGERGRAAGAAGGAEVEVGQPAGEQPRQLAADGVAFPQHHPPVRLAQSLQFRGQRRVVGPPVGVHAGAHLGRIGLRALQVHPAAVEAAHRAQAGGVLARVERGVVLAAVEVHHVARVHRHQDRGAQRAGEVVEARHVPVGVRHHARLGR